MKEYGIVFKIYDDQDSGNICFGTEKDGQRYFVKFAGAPTEQYSGDPADAIASLKSTLPIYSELKHENLIEFIEAKEIGGGCGAECVYSHVAVWGCYNPLSWGSGRIGHRTARNC